MKHRIFLFAPILLLFIATSTYELRGQTETKTPGIEFRDISLQEAQELAQSEGKLIFIDVMTSWCGPCKKMSKVTFQDQEVAEVFNNEFISLKLDAETSEDGRFVSRAYRVSGYPTLLFIDQEGKLVKKLIGYHSSSKLLLKAKPLLE